MPRPKRQLKRAAARDTQDPGQARRPGRRRAQRQQTNNNEQDVQAQLAPPQPQAVQLPQAAPQHQSALLQQAAPPQQAQDQAGNVIFNPPVATLQQSTTLMPGLISPVNSSLTSTCTDTGITSIITSTHQPTPEPINSITVPIGYHVNQPIKQKIIKGEFVNLGTLLVRDPTNAHATSTLTIDAQGNIISQPKPTTRITSIEKWTDAFLIYFSIYTAVHPLRSQQLIKYMHDVRLGAQNSNGWVSYDEQFRLRIAHNPSRNWGILDNELWLLYMTANSNKSSSTQHHKCFDYNLKANCYKPHCPYIHRCLKCNGTHPSMLCNSANPPPSHANNSFRASTPVRNNSYATFRYQTPAHQTRTNQHWAGNPRQPQRHLGPRVFSHNH